MPLRKVEGSWQKKLKAIDFGGALLTLLASTLIVVRCSPPMKVILLTLPQLGLSWAGGEYAWNSAQVLVTLCVGAFLAGVFLLWEWKGHPFPIMPLHIFKGRMVNGACLTMFVNGWNFVVQVYYIPVFYQLVYGYGAVRAGTLLLPIVLTQSESLLLGERVLLLMVRLLTQL